MSKVWSKIRKIFSSIGIALFAFGTKVNAFKPVYNITPSEYGVFNPKSEPSFWEKTLPIIRFVLIPLLLVIGLIVYWKKSKAEKKMKIYITVGIIFLGVAIYAIINWYEKSGFLE